MKSLLLLIVCYEVKELVKLKVTKPKLSFGLHLSGFGDNSISLKIYSLVGNIKIIW